MKPVNTAVECLVVLAPALGQTPPSPNQEVRIRIMPLAGGKIRELVRFFGGQGSFNSPSWSPDGKRPSFTAYGLR